jgi:hypothetical protein
MKNAKLQLNRMTISNLSTEEMLNVQGGESATYDSSRRKCCESCCDGAGQSSDIKCCDCPAEMAAPGTIG